MNRRNFFSAMRAPALAAPAIAAASLPRPKPVRWKVEPYDGSIPCDCWSNGCRSDFAARWVVVDRWTNRSRMFCNGCMADFRAAPYPFLETYK